MTPTETTASQVPATSRNSGAAADSRGTCPACGTCGATNAVLGPPRLLHCAACDVKFLAEFPSAAAREALYQEDYYEEDSGARFLGLFELAIRCFRKLRFRAIVRRRRGPGAILDVGCGRGDLLELFQEAGWNVLGTQLSKTAAKAARERRGVDVACGELPDLDLEKGRFDVVTFFHVLEHLPHPDVYLRTACDLLKPGGLLVVEVPDCASPAFRLLPLRNLCLDYPNHLVFFTPRSLGRLVERCGFEVVGRSGFSLEYSPFTTLQNLLNLLPGEPNRFYRALMRNNAASALRRSPWTWMHCALAVLLAPPALVLSALALILPAGNTLRLYCTKRESV